jgi:predicted lipoprotein with Yx(FWY)xxD motif
LVGSALVAIGLTAAACSSSPAASGKKHSGGGTKATTTAHIKTTHNSKLGTILTTAKGFTIYTRSTDPMNGSTCSGACAALWPPLMVKSMSSIDPGMSGFGTIHRPGGGLQATYHGHALYTYTGDTKAGQTNGQGLKSYGTWFAATVGSNSSSSGGGGATSTTSGSGGGGSGGSGGSGGTWG